MPDIWTSILRAFRRSSPDEVKGARWVRQGQDLLTVIRLLQRRRVEAGEARATAAEAQVAELAAATERSQRCFSRVRTACEADPVEWTP